MSMVCQITVSHDGLCCDKAALETQVHTRCGKHPSEVREVARAAQDLAQESWPWVIRVPDEEEGNKLTTYYFRAR